jgi:hypothetical protein
VSEQLQLRRGTATQTAAFTGAQGEIVIDTTNNRAIVHDGATAGGFAAAKLAEVITNTRRAIADAAATIGAGDRLVAYTSLTASRAVALCAASAFPTGTILLIVDESGACSAASKIVVNRAGSDTINGATSLAIAAAYGGLALESNGVNAWTAVSRQLSFSDLSGGVSAMQSWPAVMIGGYVDNVNFNAANTDTPIAITLPAGIANYKINGVIIANASASLTTATVGLFTAPGGAGTAILSGGSAITVSTGSANINNNVQFLSINNAVTQSFNLSTLYLRVGTAQGAAATASVVIYIWPLP